MYKQVTEKYVLTERDEMVLTFQGGNINILINNEIQVHPQSLNIKSTGIDVISIDKSKVNKIITTLNVECEVPE